MEHEMFLYHYYDIRSGPFKSLTAVSPAKANEVIGKIKAERPDSLCAQRDDNYVELRQNCERKLREAFAAKGGIMEIPSPHYMVLGKKNGSAIVYYELIAQGNGHRTIDDIRTVGD